MRPTRRGQALDLEDRHVVGGETIKVPDTFVFPFVFRLFSRLCDSGGCPVDAYREINKGAKMFRLLSILVTGMALFAAVNTSPDPGHGAENVSAIESGAFQCGAIGFKNSSIGRENCQE